MKKDVNSVDPEDMKVVRFNPAYNGLDEGFGTVIMVETPKGEWVRYADLASVDIDGLRKAVREAIAVIEDHEWSANVNLEDATAILRAALERIVARTVPTSIDTDEDCKRDLYHIAMWANQALVKARG